MITSSLKSRKIDVLDTQKKPKKLVKLEHTHTVLCVFATESKKLHCSAATISFLWGHKLFF